MLMRTAKVVAAGALLMALAASTASAEVQLSIRSGRVTLVATNATVRQILTEWARVGQTKIVNVDRISGGPLTLQLTNMPEREALDFLLRSVTGYMAAPRAVVVANLSHYDRILILPTAAVMRAPVAAPPPVAHRQPIFQPQSGEADDDQPSIVQPRGPLFPTFQLTQPVNPQQQGAASATPGAFPPPPAALPPGAVVSQEINGRPLVVTPYPGATTVGAPRPGMVVPPPGPPGAPGVIVQPGQPVPAPDN